MSIEAMKQALKALTFADEFIGMKPYEHVAEEAADGHRNLLEAIKALEEALAKQEQGEPVAWEPIETAPKDGSMVLICLPRQMNIVVRAWYNKIHNFWQTDYEGEGGITRPTYFHEGDLWHPIPPLYTTPQQRTWVGLTDEEANELWESTDSDWELMKRVEAKLKEKNTIIQNYPEKDKT